MAMRHEDLSPEEKARQRALDRSWMAAQTMLEDQEFRSHLEVSIHRVKGSDASPITSDEFLAQTEASAD